jgi:hypothetical protein
MNNCNHEFKLYEPLMAAPYEYCIKCDAKKGEVTSGVALVNHITPIANELQKRLGSKLQELWTYPLVDEPVKPPGLNSGAVLRWWDNDSGMADRLEEIQKQINENQTKIYQNIALMGESKIKITPEPAKYSTFRGLDAWLGTEPSSNYFFVVDRSVEPYRFSAEYVPEEELSADESYHKLESKVEDLMIKYGVNSEAHNGLFAELMEAIEEWDEE